MKKRKPFIAVLVVAVVLALVIFVQPVQSFAIDALSVFRVRDINAITITFDDIQYIMQKMQDLEALLPTAGMDSGDRGMGSAALPGHSFPGDAGEGAFSGEGAGIPGFDEAGGLDRVLVPIDSPADFKAFSLKLPHALGSETPSLMMLDSYEQTITLDVGKMNSILTLQDAQVLPDFISGDEFAIINGVLTQFGVQALPDSIDGAEITIQTPALAIAEYSENILIATQAPVFSGDSQALSALGKSLLSSSLLPDNLKSQLADIDLTEGVIYVPVIEGFGRRTTIGNVTGYMYSLSDLETLVGSFAGGLLPSGAPDVSGGEYEDASVIIWARGGVAYILIGAQPASKLIQIAGSVR